MSDNRYKILFLSDHPLSTSGVGTQARWLINGLLETNKYSFYCYGAAIKHEDHNVTKVNDNWIIKPTEGFGNPIMLRESLASLRPDAVVLFTDPRFFLWLYHIEDEIHQVCPIVYNHLWDECSLYPDYNDYIYKATDTINCINYPTYQMIHERYPEKTNYIPHAVPPVLYYPMLVSEKMKAKRALLGNDKDDYFTLLYVSRNARRKRPGDVLMSFKMFLDDLQKKEGHSKALLILHADPKDSEGPNLFATVDKLGIKNNIVFSKDRVDFSQMNQIYNISDCVINISCNEGFGLSALEAKMCAKPVIAVKTGGLTRQVEDHETGKQFGIGLNPEVKTLVGTQHIPYIYEDFVSNETISNAIMSMYKLGSIGRDDLGWASLEHAKKNYNLVNLVKDWDASLEKTIKEFKNKNNRWTIDTL